MTKTVLDFFASFKTDSTNLKANAKEQNRHYGFYKAKFTIKLKVNLTKKI